MSQLQAYLSQVAAVFADAVMRLTRTPSHSRKEEARRGMARRWLFLAAGAAVAIIALIVTTDLAAIKLMPPRRAESLWPLRIFTTFSSSEFVLTTLAICLAVLMLAGPRLRGVSRSIFAAFSTRIQYVFLSVLIAVSITEILKPLIGRGRPFVGDNVLSFSPFNGTAAFESLPSGHATTALALAFAVSSVWPRLTPAMWTYAVLSCICRVVLLAHHPSDVVAGALVGVVCAMFVRYWFAARRLGFSIASGGAIVALEGPSWTALKRVARSAIAP